MPKVSVIVPAYNAARFLRTAIESVRAQTLADWECIIVNDGSKDQTGALADEIAATDERISVIHQENSGVCITRNVGAAAAAPDSRYLIFLDYDDLLEPTALEVMSRYLDEHPEVGLVGCQFTRIDANGDPMKVHPLKSQLEHRTRWVPGPLGVPRNLGPDEYETPFITFLCGTGQGPHALYRKSVFERTEGFDPRFTGVGGGGHDDTDMFCQMSLQAPVHYLPDRLYRYRDHEQNVSKKGERFHRNHIVFLQKWRTAEPSTPDQRRTLAAALRYYDRIYEPLRHLRVAAIALSEFLADPKKFRFLWAWKNLSEGLTLLVRRNLRPRLRSEHPAEPGRPR